MGRSRWQPRQTALLCDNYSGDRARTGAPCHDQWWRRDHSVRLDNQQLSQHRPDPRGRSGACLIDEGHIGASRSNSPHQRNNMEYRYVGPSDLMGESPTRQRILSTADALTWIQRTHQQGDSENQVVATFIVDTQGTIWIADRQSEHVACAAGQPVLSAGEITFQVRDESVIVTAITNQSTGYCPEPESWPAVAAALTEVGLAHPPGFTREFQFRRCAASGSINIVKDDWLVCDVCDSELDRDWNFITS